MDLTFEPLGDDHLADALAFLRSANPFSQRTWGWDTGRFIDWRWGSNTLRSDDSPGFFARHGAVMRYERRIVGLVISEVGADDHCVLTALPDRSLLAAALTWLINRHDGDSLVLYPSDDAGWVHGVLTDLGFDRGEVAGLEWGYDLTTLDAAGPDPAGFVIDTLSHDRSADFAGIDQCLEGAFGGMRDRVRVLRSLETNPLFRPELNVVARHPEGRIAAYCRGTVDPDSGVCGIDPVATHPDFQGRGLGAAIVRKCFTTQRELGGTTSYIGSAPEGSPGSRLYRSLDPISVTSHSTWTRPAN